MYLTPSLIDTKHSNIAHRHKIKQVTYGRVGGCINHSSLKSRYIGSVITNLG